MRTAKKVPSIDVRNTPDSDRPFNVSVAGRHLRTSFLGSRHQPRQAAVVDLIEIKAIAALPSLFALQALTECGMAP